MKDLLLEIEDLSVRDGEQRILDRVSLKIPEKEIISILGETGSGKTTLAKSISGILPRGLKAEGKIFYRSRSGRVDLNGLSAQERDAYRGREILWIPQNSAASLNPLINLERQLLLPMIKRLKMSGQQARREIEEIFDLLDLSPGEKILKSYPHQLSGGMKVRAMIAVGLAMKSRLLILDEPTKGLDADRCAGLTELIREMLCRFSLTVILISHDLEMVERHTQYTAVLYQGRLVDSGPTEEVLFRRPHSYVRALRKALPAHGMEVSDFEC